MARGDLEREMPEVTTHRDVQIGAAELRPEGPQEWRGAEGSGLPLVARYAASLLLVAAATLLAFIVDHVIAAPNLTLIFVVPVVIAATALGWGPSLLAVSTSVLAFDFFFTAPFYSFRIASPSDIWAAGLLLVIAAIVGAIAAESRRRAVEARGGAEQAQALQALAHVVIESRPQSEIVDAAATALSQIFGAPAVVFMQRASAFGPVATAGGAKITTAEAEAAKGALDTRLPARAETYPYHQSTFDFWPVATPNDSGCVIGVSFGRSGRGRPVAPERFVEIVAACLASAFRASGKVPNANRP
jgi:two-component system sensor histidine kinase KdpD